MLMRPHIFAVPQSVIRAGDDQLTDEDEIVLLGSSSSPHGFVHCIFFLLFQCSHTMFNKQQAV